MKIRKITITIPKKTDGVWMFQWGVGGRPTKRKNPSLLFNAIKKRLLRTQGKEKTAIVVKQYIDSHLEIINESCDSCNHNYLLFCLACFLENYLEEEFLNLQINAYKELGQNP